MVGVYSCFDICSMVLVEVLLYVQRWLPQRIIAKSVVSTGGVGIASEKFYFSVEEDSIAKRLQNFEGQNVKLHYKQKNGTLPWRGESEYIVDGAETAIP
jgi:hypothetical protein